MKTRILLLAALLLTGLQATTWACRGHGRSNNRACFANQKTIAGAIEMYNLDFNTNVPEITPELWGELKNKGYLQSIPNDPGYGNGTRWHYVMARYSGNGIMCIKHGPIQPNVDPDEDIDPDSPRQLLEASGITDPKLLEEALEEKDRGGYYRRRYRDRPFWTAVRVMTLGLAPFASQPAAVMRVLGR